MPTSLPTHLFSSRQLVTDATALITFEADASFDRGRPDGVFFPDSAADVSRLVRWAAQHGVPLVARGAGTGLSGGAVAERGGIVVEFARLNRIVELDPRGRNGIVQPGVVNLHLDAAARKLDLYFPPDPSSGRSALLGGNLGENAGGPHCFKYGVTTNYVAGLEVVLADGAIVRTGGQACDYPEYDLTGLFVGSEGTLGLITQADVRLIRNPPAVKTLMVSFGSDEEAGAAVSAIIAAGLVPATLEMMDQKVMAIIEAYVHVGLPVAAQAALIVEVDGYPSSLDSQLAEIVDILQAHGGYDLRIARSEEERQQLWYGRKSAAGAFARMAPAFYLVDVTVPRSKLPETLRAVNEICERYALRVGHVFHAGDGNLHPAIVFDPQEQGVFQRILEACREIVALCVNHEGSLTGEHGVGMEKRSYMTLMYDGAELSALRDVKEACDPQNLLNPGKILPEELPPVVRHRGEQPAGEAFAPRSAQEAAAGLAALAAARRTVRIGGAAAGDRRGADIWLSTAQLRGVRKLAPADLYVTAGAGTPLAELVEHTAAGGMQLPLAIPWADATLGGLVSANVNGPLRMRYGGWRDNLLAATVALADGRVIRAGRPVVKNVAGYDLARLLVGAHGTLGLLVDVTLKLTPPPRARCTLAISAPSLAQALAWAHATAPAWLVTAGVVVVQDEPSDDGQAKLLFTLEGLAEDVAAEREELTAQLLRASAPAPTLAEAGTATAAWAEFLSRTPHDACLARAGVPPQHLDLYWSMIPEEARREAQWLVDVAAGLVYGRMRPVSPAAARVWVDAVRQPALALRGYAVLQHYPTTFVTALDRWGYQPDGLTLMRRLKERWDPLGVLNPGEFVV